MATRNTQKMLKMASGTLTGEEAVLTAVVAAAPAGGTGAAAGAWDTSGNRDTAIAAINNCRTRIIEIEAILQKFGLMVGS